MSRAWYSRRDHGDMLLPPEAESERFKSNLRNRLDFIEEVERTARNTGEDLDMHPLKIVSLRVEQTGNSLVREVDGDEGRGFLDPRYGVKAEAVIAPRPATLWMLTGDCAPISMFGERYVAIAHGSWRNLILKDVLREVVAKLTRLGEVPANLRVEIGPTICQDHYQVDGAVYDPARERFPSLVDEQTFQPDGDRWRMSIPLFAIRWLADLGVSGVRSREVCTAEGEYFSSRGGDRERFATLVVAG